MFQSHYFKLKLSAFQLLQSCIQGKKSTNTSLNSSGMILIILKNSVQLYSIRPTFSLRIQAVQCTVYIQHMYTVQYSTTQENRPVH